jgi:predicted RNase H-like HicB family nuclease
MLEYHAAYYKYPEDDGWYVVSVLDFPGVNTQGRTLREARFMVKDALKLMAKVISKGGESCRGRTQRRRIRKRNGSKRSAWEFWFINQSPHEARLMVLPRPR